MRVCKAKTVTNFMHQSMVAKSIIVKTGIVAQTSDAKTIYIDNNIARAAEIFKIYIGTER